VAYAFHDRVFDPASGVLAGPDESIQLRRQATALLADLIERRARWVTPRELQTRIWRDVRVSPSSLSTLLHEVRRAVGDDGRAQRIIRTCRLRGYRFIAELRFGDGPGVPGVPGALGPVEAVCDAPLAGAHPTRPVVGTSITEPAVESLTESAMNRADRSLRTAERHGPRHLEVSGGHAEPFAAEWADVAADRGWQLHRGRRTDEACPALWPWWQVAQSIRAAAEAAGEARVVRTWARLCAETDAVVRRPRRADDPGERQRQFALTDGLTRGLLSWATQRPTAIWLAGLDERDPGTTRLLTFVVSSASPAPLWILSSQLRPPARALHAAARTDHVGLETPLGPVGRA